MTTEVDWRDALPAPPRGHRLEAALFTTYEPAQPELLVEHLLPSVLSLSRELDPEPDARSLYFGELALAMERLRGRLTVISSPTSALTAEEQGASTRSAYPWLSRYVAPFFTGARGGAVQHAKLWMLHWVKDEETRDEEGLLEIVISSANLTLSSMRSQLQAGWRCRVTLEARNSRANSGSWGPLPRFLQALGESAGMLAEARTGEFQSLLGRCRCPPGVQFVASIPEARQRPNEGSSWGALALGKAAPSGSGALRIQVCTPFIGEWQSKSLRQWSSSVGVEPTKVSLSWIDSRHPWAGATGGGWRMTQTALECLRTEGLEMLRLGHSSDGPVSAFHEEHVPADERWSHAKLYLLRRGRTRRLLVTSANFSSAAWGTGTTAPRNFELGVVLNGDWPIDPAEEPFGEEHDVFTSEAQPPAVEAEILWGQATWDGETVTLNCRTHSEGPSPIAHVQGGAVRVPPKTRMDRTKKGGQLWEAGVSWEDGKRPPITASFARGAETLEVPVVDLRESDAFVETPLPEVDPEIAQALRDALLLESYGGPMVEAEDLRGISGEATFSPQGSDAVAEDYSVAAFVEARGNFLVLEKWAREFADSRRRGADAANRIRTDGEQLADLFTRRGASATDAPSRLPAVLVAEEFRSRLEETES